jgi:hypothetical protein
MDCTPFMNLAGRKQYFHRMFQELSLYSKELSIYDAYLSVRWGPYDFNFRIPLRHLGTHRWMVEFVIAAELHTRIDALESQSQFVAAQKYLLDVERIQPSEGPQKKLMR